MPNNCQVYPEDTAANLPPKSSLSTGSLTGSLWSISSKAGSKALSAIDYIGLKLADAFGITSSRYEEYLWEAERMKKKEEKEKEYLQQKENAEFIAKSLP